MWKEQALIEKKEANQRKCRSFLSKQQCKVPTIGGSNEAYKGEHDCAYSRLTHKNKLVVAHIFLSTENRPYVTVVIKRNKIYTTLQLTFNNL